MLPAYVLRSYGSESVRIPSIQRCSSRTVACSVFKHRPHPPVTKHFRHRTPADFPLQITASMIKNSPTASRTAENSMPSITFKFNSAVSSRWEEGKQIIAVVRLSTYENYFLVASLTHMKSRKRQTINNNTLISQQLRTKIRTMILRIPIPSDVDKTGFTFSMPGLRHGLK
jgi:hypothetical protein